MIISGLFRLVRVALRDKPQKIKASSRYRVTLDMKKAGPIPALADTNEWLLKIGLVPTGRPDVWKAWENQLSHVPQNAILNVEKL